MSKECKQSQAAYPIESETLSRALEIALIKAIKDDHMMYCRYQRRYHLLRGPEHAPQVILKRSYKCKHIICSCYDTCLAVALDVELKEDLLEFHRAFLRMRSLENALIAFQ